MHPQKGNYDVGINRLRTNVLDTTVPISQSFNRASSMPQMKENSQKAKVVIRRPISTPPEADWAIFSFIERNRLAVMSSPLCLAAIMILLNTFAGQRVHAVIEFLSGAAQK
jgi:hypothetical protein